MTKQYYTMFLCILYMYNTLNMYILNVITCKAFQIKYTFIETK